MIIFKCLLLTELKQAKHRNFFITFPEIDDFHFFRNISKFLLILPRDRSLERNRLGNRMKFNYFICENILKFHIKWSNEQGDMVP